MYYREAKPKRKIIIQRNHDQEKHEEVAESLRLNKSIVSHIFKQFRATSQVVATKKFV